MTDRRVLIVGGHGKIALLTAPLLAASGFTVESLIRNPAHADDVREAGATPVVLDIEQATQEQLADTFTGAEAVVFSAGAGGGNPERTHAVDHLAAVRTMDAALSAGVTRYVMVSYSRAEVDIDVLDPQNSFYPYAAAKHHADAYLRATDLDYTILGPGRLTLDPATSSIRVLDASAASQLSSEGGAEATSTSRANVAEVIRHVLVHGVARRTTVNFFDGDTPLDQALKE